MSYRVEDYYSPEAKRQVEVMNAIQGQIRIRRSAAHDAFMADPNREGHAKGMLDALDSVTHTLGEMSFRLVMEERARQRAEKTDA